MNKLPIAPIGTHIIKYYNSFHDCVSKEHWERGYMVAYVHAQETVKASDLLHSFTVDHRVGNSLTSPWTVTS